MLAFVTMPSAVAFDPKRTDFTPYGLTCVNWQASVMPRPDHHNEIELNMLKAGRVTYLLGGQKVSAEAGRLFVFWASIPHQIVEHTPDADYVVATIPLQTFLSWRLPEAFVQNLLQGHVQTEPTCTFAAVDDAVFDRWVRDLEDDPVGRDALVLVEMNARLARLAHNLAPDGSPRHLAAVPDAGVRKVERMASHIVRYHAQPMTVGDIAGTVDLHPNYAMSIFQKAFGVTLVEYLTHYRVAHAQRLLITTEARVTDIAHEAGFGSISRFNEAFSKLTGTTPREYRKSHSLNR